MPAAKFACFTHCCDTAAFLTTKTRLIKSKYLSYLRDDTQGTFGAGEVKSGTARGRRRVHELDDGKSEALVTTARGEGGK